MQQNNYYQILAISPQASPDEIRKAFRTAAQKYHPDKNPDNPLAAARFSEILEAYEILSDPEKRKSYHISYPYSFGQTPKTIDPETILKQCISLERLISSIPVHQLDLVLLTESILEILSIPHIELLIKKADAGLKNEVLNLLLLSAKALPYPMFLTLTEKLDIIADDLYKKKITTIILQKKKEYFFEKYSFAIAVIITLCICLLIFSGSH